MDIGTASVGLGAQCVRPASAARTWITICEKAAREATARIESLIDPHTATMSAIETEIVRCEDFKARMAVSGMTGRRYLKLADKRGDDEADLVVSALARRGHHHETVTALVKQLLDPLYWNASTLAEFLARIKKQDDDELYACAARYRSLTRCLAAAPNAPNIAFRAGSHICSESACLALAA
jgi:hypothetical protein